MSDHIYKIIELVGSSKTDIEAAVDNALEKASESVQNMRWFEVKEIRGHLEDGKVSHWQVDLKVGFTVDGEAKGSSSSKEEKEEGEAKGKKEEGEKGESKGGDQYRCTVCGYIYDPKKGDPDNGIKPGTSFKDLPDDWKCPECGVGKSEFEKVE